MGGWVDGNGNYFILSDLINNKGAYTAGQSYSCEYRTFGLFGERLQYYNSYFAL